MVDRMRLVNVNANPLDMQPGISFHIGTLQVRLFAYLYAVVPVHDFRPKGLEHGEWNKWTAYAMVSKRDIPRLQASHCMPLYLAYLGNPKKRFARNSCDVPAILSNLEVRLFLDGEFRYLARKDG